MPVNASLEGRVYPAETTFVVGREHVRDFARAVGATDPRHVDVEAARASGYADVVAPPTFAVTIAQRAEARFVSDPEAGIDFSRVVHGEEKFVHHAPLVAGEEVSTTVHVDRVREVGGHAMVVTRCEIATDDGPRTTVTSNLVVRGED